MDEPVKLNIFQRLNAIKKAVAYVQKDKKTVDGMYRAVTHDAVTAVTRSAFVEYGVLVVPIELSSVTVDSGMVTAKGNPIIRFEAKYRVNFINIDEPGGGVFIELTAHALDQGDKAPGKAHSYATKYAVLKVLQLETGEDEESREATKPKKHADIPLPNAPITPSTGAGEGLEPETKEELDHLFSRMVDFMDTKDIQGAHDAFYALTDMEHQLYVWERLKTHSAFRRAIKKLHDDKKLT